MEQKYSISVDWFQVSATRDPRQELAEGLYLYGTATTDDGRELCYHLTLPREFNAIFGACLSVELHGFRLATIYFSPRPSTIPKSLCMVKMANPVLYSSRWCWYLCDILAALKWKFKAISRVDLCADFNYFSQGLAPTEFIRRYLNSGPWNPGQVSYFRVNGNKYSLIGEKKVSSEIFRGKEKTTCVHDVQYIRFGSHSSGVCTYLYNKTLELNTKGNKRYIRDHWQRVGLVDTTDTPVFRLEISIGNQATFVKVKRSEEEKSQQRAAASLRRSTLDQFSVRSLSLDDFGTQQFIERVFWSYASHYFRFKIVGTQATPYHWTDLVLFDVRFVTSMKPCRISYSLDSGVAERNAANKLDQLLYTATDLSVVEMVSLENAVSVLRRLSGLKQQSFSQEQLEKVKNGLLSGWSWAELQRRRILPLPLLEKLKERVDNYAARELMYYRNDPYVAEAMDNLDATYQMLNEQPLEPC